MNRFSDLRDDLFAIWQAGLEGVRVDRLLRENLRLEDRTLYVRNGAYPLRPGSRIVVIGAGKASGHMAAALEAELEPLLRSDDVRLLGRVNVPDDLVKPLHWITLHGARPAGVNEPTEAGVSGTTQMLELVDSLTPNDLCLALLSGGGSALLPAPIPEITLAEKVELTRFLSGTGANINELNTVRKQLSTLKGGGLLNRCAGKRLVTLILSDVLGDPLDIIASGPTVPNSSGPVDALAVLRKYNAPFPKIRQLLQTKADRQAGAFGNKRFDNENICNVVIGNNAVAVDEAGIKAEKLGYSHVMISTRESEGPAEELGKHLLDIALQMRDAPTPGNTNRPSHGPDCLISGGEPVVRLIPPERRGLGGRNQQLVLAALAELLDREEMNSDHDHDPGLAFLSCGTDGEDGPTDAAGAFFDTGIIAETRRLGLNPHAYLERNDAYRFFERVGGLIKTGPTGTNVCDLRVIVVRR